MEFGEKTPKLISLVQFVWAGVDTVIALGCWPKQLHQDPWEEEVLVWSGLFVVERWSHLDPTQLPGALVGTHNVEPADVPANLQQNIKRNVQPLSCKATTY